MPSVSVYRHGTAGGTPGVNHGNAGIRGEVGGWTAASSRRNLRFLWSVDVGRLTGAGWSFTLTVRDCPPSPKDWATWCAIYWKRLMAADALRLHWVIEWQRRGCPHLHGSVYFPASMTRREVENVLLDGWLYRNPYGPARISQRCLPIYDAVGWGEYVAKHAARGVRHYQRSPENIPLQWQGRTGRMWGYRGDWPLTPPVRLTLQGSEGDGGFFAFRRLVRSYARSRAYRSGDGAGRSYARSMLKANTRELGEVRGVSHWVPQPVIEDLMLNLSDRGFSLLPIVTRAEGGEGGNGLPSQLEANGSPPPPLSGADSRSRLI